MRKIHLILLFLTLSVLTFGANGKSEITSAEKALEEAELSGDVHEMILQLARCGNLYYDDGNLEKSIECCRRAFSLMEENDDRSLTETSHMISHSLFIMSRIFNKNGQTDKAVKYLDKSIDFEKALNRNMLICRRYEDKAEILIAAGEYGKAFESIQEIGKYLDSNSSSFYHIPQMHYLEGLCYEGLGNSVKACAAFEEAVETSLKHNNFKHHIGVPMYFLKAAEYRMASGDTASAETLYRQAKEIVETNRYKVHAPAVYSGLAKIYAGSDPVLSEEYLRKSTEYDYVAELDNLSSKIAMESIKVPTEERKNLIISQKWLTAACIFLATLLLLLCILAICQIRYLRSEARESTLQNEDLIHSLKQKNDMLEVARTIQEDAMSRRENEGTRNMLTAAILTKREMEIAELICEGLLNKEIAFKLNISVRTVENHRNSIYRKIGVSNSVELVKYLQSHSQKKESAS